MSSRVHKLVLTGVFVALAIVVATFIRIDFQFLTYEPKDVVITIAGFILGPWLAAGIAALVAGIEMFTVGSATGIIGLIMNAIASISFVVPAALIYRTKPSFMRAALGVLVGGITMTLVMIAWNYFLVPIFLGAPREVVVAMIPTLLLPFNAGKAAINAILILFLYEQVKRALDAMGLGVSTMMVTREQLPE